MNIFLKDKNINLDIPYDFLNLRFNMDVINQVYNTYTNNIKHGTKLFKNRALVSGSNKKLWAQKGTGRARVGSGKSPQFRSGGVAFNTKIVFKKKKINKKMYKYFVKFILYKFFISNNIIFIDKFDFNIINTKVFINKIRFFTEYSKVMLIVVKNNIKIDLSARNIHDINVNYINNINILDIIKSNILIFEIEAFINICRDLFYD